MYTFDYMFSKNQDHHTKEEDSDKVKVGRIFIGTSGYYYADWKKIFYSPELSQDRWLDHYCEHFNFCELNFSYYRLPTARQMKKYAGYPISFSVKAHQSMTHDRKLSVATTEAFKESLAELNEQGRLANILLQFPYSFHKSSENRDYLGRLIQLLEPLPIVVEFRHSHWISSDILKDLARAGTGVVVTDSPRIKGAMPLFQAVTSSQAYIRYHGRNHANWWSGDNVSRYDYSYSDSELREWLPRIKKMAQQAQSLHIAFNNHAKGYAVQNAQMMKSMLKAAGLMV